LLPFVNVISHARHSCDRPAHGTAGKLTGSIGAQKAMSNPQ
jgi:hypothetical protein